MYYELHITVESNLALKSEIENTAWKFSQITDDPILGPGPKMYATIHKDAVNIKEVRKSLDEMVEYIRLKGFNVLRKKIELVLLDEIYG
jgi:hypothetical protein